MVQLSESYSHLIRFHIIVSACALNGPLGMMLIMLGCPQSLDWTGEWNGMDWTETRSEIIIKIAYVCYGLKSDQVYLPFLKYRKVKVQAIMRS